LCLYLLITIQNEKGKHFGDVMGCLLSAKKTTAGVAGATTVLNDGCAMQLRNADGQAS
jgi:hypothetical protein